MVERRRGRRRRSWTLDEKRRIIDESLEDNASIAKVARRHDLNANQLFTWRRQCGLEPADPRELAPVLLRPSMSRRAEAVGREVSPSAAIIDSQSARGAFLDRLLDKSPRRN